ncbi:MAG: Nucleoside-diphosphate-sugar epimerase [Candidatus Yanofskybacteria bacterium GW2011_GWF1_44_227]|uniref:Nucleoside-diphosphate-sugar epimerase n=1 Tax=Candidatus Yanofskybacteria bacterium GW2011_GWE2_40_11 TaxID=1619033 RepID=A0A0G0QKV4_9BACT|nr:MAG: Nucleoside-diphosphate-sugar epimerase [Candidatus Moranbacteria bacterium GW2011_GWF2_36_839]KKR37592.1 MAG: Nucleoside-diphosphate-sugar epimerase [Candidatus Yanofskybacteria bacterium GW2011_GWE1_40_10]KKR40738.1 MAG: Nucleoside-diphosphate-sugar epimerase [Candidatus Yanofskybacteria bacterium GW2011_GWE2_40_11]KKT52737.1 MAG: Nucleoside-diphosphate-sugar epimerase [Candidatus Yanofskybacteria bacterium GW2011_GWF1_44_227]OGN36021.1 MAG: hypothetical protein A2207_03110 [Candidatus
MKILIAGGAGYIGTRLSNYLADKGHKVTVLDLFWFGDFLDKKVEKIKGDIFSLKEERVRGFDAVVFLAGLSNDPMAEFSPSLNFIYNGSSPSYLAYIAKRAGVPRFIYASSCSIYGNSVDKINTENSETISIYPYGISKWQGEFAVRKFSDSKFDVVCFRQGTLSGFSPRMRFDLMVNTMYMRAQTVGKITVDNPNIWRPLLSMSDAISAYVFAIESRKNISGVYNLSSGNFKVGEVAKRVQSYFLDHHNKKIAIEWNKKKSFRNYRVSTQKIKKKFGFNFSGSIEEILGDLNKNIKPGISYGDDRFYNIKVFNKIMSKGIKL